MQRIQESWVKQPPGHIWAFCRSVEVHSQQPRLRRAVRGIIKFDHARHGWKNRVKAPGSGHIRQYEGKDIPIYVR